MNAPIADGVIIGEAEGAPSGKWFELDVKGAIDWVWNMDTNEEKFLSIRISSTHPDRCIYSSLTGPPLDAPHLSVNVVKAKPEAVSSTAISPTVSPTLPPGPQPEYRIPGEALMLLATDDATIAKENPDTNLGMETTMMVNDNGTFTHDILIRFDLTEMYQTTPKSAVLALYLEQSCDSAGVFTTTSREENWNENEVTWSNAPSYDGTGGAMIGTFGSVEGGKWFGFDVYPAVSWIVVTTQSSLTFRVSSDNSKNCEYASIQGGKPPRLMLEF